MHKHRRTTIINSFGKGAFILALGFLVVNVQMALGHGGFEHVMGTVTKISAQSVTVETTAKKIVEVGLNAKTAYTRNDKKVAAGDLKVGDRVVIDATEADHKLVGASVKIGTTSTTAHSEK